MQNTINNIIDEMLEAKQASKQAPIMIKYTDLEREVLKRFRASLNQLYKDKTIIVSSSVNCKLITKPKYNV